MTPDWLSGKHRLLAGFLPAAATAVPHPAIAWGDKGHEIIALIAEHYLDPAARAKVILLLAGDTDTLTEHDVASEATWADKYRDSDRYTTKIRYHATRLWHFVDSNSTSRTSPPAVLATRLFLPDPGLERGATGLRPARQLKRANYRPKRL
jgi:hypothetical protein